jgi:hypothetical protein
MLGCFVPAEVIILYPSPGQPGPGKILANGEILYSLRCTWEVALVGYMLFDLVFEIIYMPVELCIKSL